LDFFGVCALPRIYISCCCCNSSVSVLT